MITTYNCKDLIAESGDRVLSCIDINTLVEGDRAFVVMNDEVLQRKNLLFFEFVAASTKANNTSVHPYHVRPNNYSGAGVWEECEAETGGRILYGAGDPPDPSELPDGVLYVKYIP
jgi:hypothetical protein